MLHVECPFAHECWRENERPRLADGSYDLDEWTRLPRPWIGPHFEKLRLLCLAVNMNEWGGRDACEKLVIDARDEIRAGRTRIHFNAPGYRGTYLYHRMGLYAAEIASAKGFRGFISDDKPSHGQVAEIYDYLAYTNHVKCSPKNSERSKPTENMWKNCGGFILQREIYQLQPQVVLILGIENHAYFTSKVVDSSSFIQTQSIRSVVVGKATLQGRNIDVVTVPHPSARNGSNYCHFADLRQALHP